MEDRVKLELLSRRVQELESEVQAIRRSLRRLSAAQEGAGQPVGAPPAPEAIQELAIAPPVETRASRITRWTPPPEPEAPAALPEVAVVATPVVPVVPAPLVAEQPVPSVPAPPVEAPQPAHYGYLGQYAPVAPPPARPAHLEPAAEPAEEAPFVERRAAEVAVPVEAQPESVTPLQAPVAEQFRPAEEARQGDLLGRSGSWLYKAGIVLFLLGVVFLFQYSVAQGWLTSEVQVGIGLLLGTALLGVALRIVRTHHALSHVMMGGAIATYYITGYAGWQLLKVPFLRDHYEIAFGFMVVVTVLAYGLAISQDDLVLSLIGTIGGLATPFLLPGEGGSVSGLVVYTCLVIAGASGVYTYKGWRSLLWTSFAGGWTILILGYVLSGLSTSDRWALQWGIAFMVLAFWVVPVVREVLWVSNRERWARPSMQKVLSVAAIRPSTERTAELYESVHAHVLATIMPLLALGASAIVWGSQTTGSTWGWTSLVGAALYAVALLLLLRADRSMVWTHAATAVVLFTLGIVLVLEGNTLLFALAAESTALHLLARRFRDQASAFAGDGLALTATAWLVLRLASAWHTVGDIPLVSIDALVDLAVAVLLVVSSVAMRDKRFRSLYRAVGEALVVAWLARELAWLDGWSNYLLLAWAIYAVGLRFAARFWKDTTTGMVSHAAFVATAGLLGFRLLDPVVQWTHTDPAVFTLPALLDLAVIGVVAGVSFLMTTLEGTVYRSVACAAALIWLWREFYWLDSTATYALLAWAAFGVGLRLARGKWADLATDRWSHIAFLATAILLAVRLAVPIWYVRHTDPAVFTIPALIDLVAMASIVGVSLLRTTGVGFWYRIGAAGALMAWLWRELYWLDGGYIYPLLAWTLLAAGLMLAAWRWSDGASERSSYMVCVGGGVLLAWRILQGLTYGFDPGIAFFNLPAAIDLGFIVAAVGISFSASPTTKLVLRAFAHAAAMGWLWRELHWLEGGYSYVLLAWAIYALAARLIANRWKEITCDIASHAAFAAGAVVFASRIAITWMEGPPVRPVFTIPGVIDLAAIAIAVTGSMMVARNAAVIYRALAHAGIMAWLAHEMDALPGGPDYILLAWAVYGFLVHLLGKRLNDKAVTLFGHSTFALAGCWAAARIVSELANHFNDYTAAGTAVFTSTGLADLAVIAAAAGASFFFSRKDEVWIYRLAAYVGLLGWLWRELLMLPDGSAYVTASWGICALAVFFVAIRNDLNRPVFWTGLGTLALVAGKLLLLDLVRVDPIWRILLFLAAGAMGMGLSYWFQNVSSHLGKGGGMHGATPTR